MHQQPISDSVIKRLQQRAETSGKTVDELLIDWLDSTDAATDSDIATSTLPRNIPYQLVLEQMTDTIALFDPQLRYVYVNPSLARATGHTQQEMIGKTNKQLNFAEADITFWRDIWDTVVQTGQEKTITAEFMSQDGLIVYESRFTPIYDKNDTLIYLMGITRDITDRSQAQQMLQDISDRIPGMILRYRLYSDGTDAIPFVSEAVSTIYEVTVEDALADSSNVWAKVHPDDLGNMADSIRASAEDLSLWDAEWRICMNDGTIKWINGLGTPYRLDDGSTIWNTLLLDITKRKQAEAINLEREQLQASLNIEKERLATVQRLVAKLAHDIRLPLSVISTSREILSNYYDKIDREKRQERLETIGKQLDYVTDLLNDLRLIEDISIQEQALKLVTRNIKVLCQVTLQDIQQSIGRHHEMLFVDNFAHKLVMINDTLVNRILLNLLSNAVKYSPKASTITLKLYEKDAHIHLQVIDEGYGIPEADLEKIFKPFYRAVAIESLTEGNGLGLSIVKDCVDNHQGHIHVESVVDKGTTFTVILPLVLPSR